MRAAPKKLPLSAILLAAAVRSQISESRRPDFQSSSPGESDEVEISELV